MALTSIDAGAVSPAREPSPHLVGLKRPTEVVDLIEDHTPLRLADAAKIAFPHGGITVAGLRREVGRGRLKIEIIAGKHFTTLADIREMRRLCRDQAKERGSISDPNVAIDAGGSRSDQAGSSATVVGTSSQDALRVKLKLLSKS